MAGFYVPLRKKIKTRQGMKNRKGLHRKVRVTMGLGLQPDGLTAGLAGHCQPDKRYP